MRGLYEIRLENLIARVMAGKFTKPENIMMVYLRPKVSVAFDIEKLTPQTKEEFIGLMRNIPNIKNGLSCVAMTGGSTLSIDVKQALMVQGVGRALGVWNLFPADLRIEADKKEAIYAKNKALGALGQEGEALPINTGLNTFDPELNGSVKNAP